MWNLANEPDLFAWPDNSEAGAASVKEMSELIKGIDPNIIQSRSVCTAMVCIAIMDCGSIKYMPIRMLL